MFDKKKYDNNYAKENYDRILITMPKGEKEKIKIATEKKGYKSVNEYIRETIKKDIEKA